MKATFTDCTEGGREREGGRVGGREGGRGGGGGEGGSRVNQTYRLYYRGPTLGLGGTRMEILVTTPRVPSAPINSCFKSYPAAHHTTHDTRHQGADM